ncbi:MAG: hypothetical protein GY801_19235 [bacterium]|nr:hypothetical protein [bacterium]
MKFIVAGVQDVFFDGFVESSSRLSMYRGDWKASPETSDPSEPCERIRKSSRAFRFFRSVFSEAAGKTSPGKRRPENPDNMLPAALVKLNSR